MNKRILICDDDEAIVEMMEIVLEQPGWDITSELDSVKVFDRVVNEKPDVLVMDLWMPKVSGDQVLRRIRKNQETKGLQVLIISASRDGESVAQNAGASTFLAKPFDIEELQEKITNLLSN